MRSCSSSLMSTRTRWRPLEPPRSEECLWCWARLVCVLMHRDVLSETRSHSHSHRVKISGGHVRAHDLVPREHPTCRNRQRVNQTRERREGGGGEGGEPVLDRNQ